VLFPDNRFIEDIIFGRCAEMGQLGDENKTIDAQKEPVWILSGHGTRPVSETNFDLQRYSKKR
jgi:hypothetical protein